MNNAQLIHQNSGVTDYRTPIAIVEAARTVMGGIELDPASSEGANDKIRADRIYEEPEMYRVGEIGDLPLMERVDHGAFSHPWSAKTAWMNHPFKSREVPCRTGCAKKICRQRGFHIRFTWEGNADWIARLVEAYEEKRIKQACNICFAATSEQWFQPLLRYPNCFLFPRTNYYLPNGDLLPGVTKGSVVTFLGKNVAKFARVFKRFGIVKTMYDKD